MLEVFASDETSDRLDALDKFNHSRKRRSLILQALSEKNEKSSGLVSIEIIRTSDSLKLYESVHSERLLNFFQSAWKDWVALGEDGQDPLCSLTSSNGGKPSAFVPGNVPLFRGGDLSVQRPSLHVMGQVGFFCTDTVTPIFEELLHELQSDAAIVKAALDSKSSSIYIIPTHPGHHSAYDSFGGYCYLNHAARIAKSAERTCVLDVDYHCGNGTAALFYDDPNVLVISLHCDPNYEYPFHSGYSDEIGTENAQNATLHIPLPPGTSWENGYRDALARALEAIQDFKPFKVIVSLGLDTYDKDPCAVRRAGFQLSGNDYREMGSMLAQSLGSLPTVFVQEGGYRMDKVAEAACDVVTTFVEHRQKLGVPDKIEV